MQKLKIKKLEGTIAYIEGKGIEQINASDFIIFKKEEGVNLKGLKEIIYKLQKQGVKKTFLILPKGIDYCIFEKGEEK